MKRLLLLLLLQGVVITQAATINMSTDLVALGIASENMVPNQPSVDSGPLLEKAVRYANSHQVNQLTVTSGTYYFLSGSSYNMNWHALLPGPTSGSLTIDFQNSELNLAHASKGGFFLTSGVNLTVQNCTIDYLQQLYTQATITAVNAAQRQLQFTVQPGWQNPSALNALNPGGAAYVYVFRNGLPWVGLTRMAAVAPFTDGSVHLTGAVTTATVGAIQVGDTAVIQVRRDVHAFLLTGLTEATLRNIRIYSGGAGVRLLGCSGSLLERVIIMPRPGTNRLISTMADGIQPQQLGLNNTIRLCRAIRTCDDGFSPSTFVYASVQAILGSRRVQVQGDATTALAINMALPNGSNVAFERASDGTILATAVLVSQSSTSPIGGMAQRVLNFDRDLPTSLVGAYLYSTDPSWRGGNLRLERNTVQQQTWARGISLWGVMDTTLFGNYIYKSSMAGIDIRHQLRVGDWIVPPAVGITITNNVIDGTIVSPNTPQSLIQLGAIEAVATSPSFAPMSQSPHQNISVQNNFIANPGRSALWIGNTAGGSVSGNYLLNPNNDPNVSFANPLFTNQASNDPVVVHNSTGITQGSNVIDRGSQRVFVTDQGFLQLAAYAPGSTVRLSALSLGAVNNPSVTLTDADGNLWPLAVVNSSTHAIDVQLPAEAGLGGARVSVTAPGISLFGTLFLDSQDNVPAINQSTFQISASATRVPASATTLSFLVVTQPGTAYQVTTTDSFATPGSGGTGTGVVNVGLSQNTGAKRTSRIIIAGQPIQVTQAGATDVSALEAWRQQYFGTIANNGNAADAANPDRDTWTNADEYIHGSNPNLFDNASPLRMSRSAADITLTFTATRAADGLTRFYRLETTSNFADASSWAAVPGYANVVGANQTVSVTQPKTASARFYRLNVWVL